MKKEAVFHLNVEEFVYPIARNSLVIRIRTARKDVAGCTVVYWNREDNLRKSQKLHWCGRDELFDFFQESLFFTKVARYQKYFFILEEADGTRWYYSARGISSQEPEDGYFEYLYANRNDVLNIPEWAYGAIYYQIFPDRFCNGNASNDPAGCGRWGEKPTKENFTGGDLEGIIQKIPYLEELGIECIYLNPVFKGDFNHKYATTDYFEIDPAFGSNQDFKKLVEECHKRGIRILLDGVFNHSGIHMSWFQDVLEKQEKSEYCDCFLITDYPVSISSQSYECVGAYPWMPKLNTSNRRVRELVLRVMDYWIAEYGIDGWRLDVADEVDAGLWQEVNCYLKSRYPETFLLGETWGCGERLLRGRQLDAVMNYLFRDAVWDYFGHQKISAEQFDWRINQMLSLYRSETNQVMYNLIDSHDTERFLYICKEDKRLFRLAAAFQILFLGAPAIYYGDETGMSGENDPGCRGCMLWGEEADRELFSWYQKLISIRKEYDCVRRGNYQTVIADTSKDVFAFVRKMRKEAVYVILFKNCPTDESVKCPVFETGNYQDLLTGEMFCAESGEGVFYQGDMAGYQGSVSIGMEPYSVRVIIPKKEEK